MSFAGSGAQDAQERCVPCALLVAYDPPHGGDGVLFGDVRIDLPKRSDCVLDLLGSPVASGLGVVDRLFDDVSYLGRIHHGYPLSSAADRRVGLSDGGYHRRRATATRGGRGQEDSRQSEARARRLT